MELTSAQKRIINSRPNGIRIIKGEEGCGKTVSAMNRAFKLQQSFCAGHDDEILIVAKDNEHLRNLEHVHESIVNKTIIQKSFFDEENKKKLEMNDINSIILLYFSQYNHSHKTGYSIADSKTCERIMCEAVDKVRKSMNKTYKRIKFLNHDYIRFFMDEIKWIKECGFTKEQDYLSADRSSRLVSLYGTEEKTIRMRKNSKARECVFHVMKEYNSLLKCENLVDFEDAAFYAAKECRKKNTRKYTHIIVDEVQKFSRIELEIMDILYNKKIYSSMTFVIDTDKLENSCGWINKKRKFSSLGYNIKGKSITLKEKFNEAYDLKSNKAETAEESNVSRKFSNAHHKRLKKSEKHIQNNELQYQYSLLELDSINTDNSIYNRNNDISQNLNLEPIHNEDIKSNEEIDKNWGGDSIMEDNTVKYIDLNRNVCHEFICDFYEAGEVYTSDDNFKEKVEDLVTIPVFNEIAAGSPILMNDEVEYSCNIPKAWVRSNKDLFILKIKGDSMVNKNINDGDHVLINKGRYPSSNDVVAVEIEGEATLKTFKTKGKQIILKPENDKYDPIVLNGDQECSILGVAIGILKNFS